MINFKLVPVGDIESEFQPSSPSDPADELRQSGSKTCLESLLYLRPICVVLNSQERGKKKWAVIAGTAMLPMIAARFRGPELIPVLVIDEADELLRQTLPVVETLFGSIFNVPRPTLAQWTAAAKLPVIAELGPDLRRPEVAGRFLKGRPRKSNAPPKEVQSPAPEPDTMPVRKPRKSKAMASSAGPSPSASESPPTAGTGGPDLSADTVADETSREAGQALANGVSIGSQSGLEPPRAASTS